MNADSRVCINCQEQSEEPLVDVIAFDGETLTVCNECTHFYTHARIVTVDIRIEDPFVQANELTDLIQYGVSEGNYTVIKDEFMTFEELDKLVATA